MRKWIKITCASRQNTGTPGKVSSLGLFLACCQCFGPKKRKFGAIKTQHKGFWGAQRNRAQTHRLVLLGTRNLSFYILIYFDRPLTRSHTFLSITVLNIVYIYEYFVTVRITKKSVQKALVFQSGFDRDRPFLPSPPHGITV